MRNESSILSQGIISSRAAGRLITVAGNAIINQGTLEVINGGTIAVTAQSMINLAGTISSASNSLVTISAPLTWAGGSIGGDGPLILNSTASITDNAVKPGTGVLRVNSSFSVAPGKRLDLTTGKLILKASTVGSWNGSSYTGVSALIQSGRNNPGSTGGRWAGPGIVTSQSDAVVRELTSIGVATAAQVKSIAATRTSLWSGQTVSGTDVLVMYTYAGDANLDGKIDVADYARLDFNLPLHSAGWFNGDFNYDGKIDVLDYGIIDMNVRAQDAPFSTASDALAATSQVARLTDDSVATVPEPCSSAVFVFGAASAGGIRTRRRK